MYRSLLPALLLLSAPAAAQDVPVAEDGAAFPDELILLPQDVQSAAESGGVDAEAEEVPDDMNAVPPSTDDATPVAPIEE